MGTVELVEKWWCEVVLAGRVCTKAHGWKNSLSISGEPESFDEKKKKIMENLAEEKFV